MKNYDRGFLVGFGVGILTMSGVVVVQKSFHKRQIMWMATNATAAARDLIIQQGFDDEFNKIIANEK